jgi:MFS family permease
MNISLLRNKNYTLLVFGQFISLIGTIIQNIALSLYVLKITGSGKMFASVLALQIIPRIILGPICGVLVDWFDKKKIIVILDLISGLLIATFYIVSVTTELQIYHIYILVISLSIISSMFNPTVPSILPTLITKDELMDANSLLSLVTTIGNLIAPLLAGIIFGLYGIQVVFIVNALSFIGSAISEMFISVPKNERKYNNLGYGKFRADFAEGIQFIKKTRILLTITITALIMNFVINPIFSVGITFISKMVIKISDMQYGAFQTTAMVGTLLAPIIIGRLTKRFKLDNVFIGGIAICVAILGLIALSISPIYMSRFYNNTIPFITLVILTTLFGITLTIANLAIMTLQQKALRVDMMGRYYAVSGALAMAAAPLGQMIFGMLFDRIASYQVLFIGFGFALFSIIVIAKAIKNSPNNEIAENSLKVAEVDI